jgi:outer membrane protein assembly factor BamE (lipoprotein component of BamABCDE complex)
MATPRQALSSIVLVALLPALFGLGGCLVGQSKKTEFAGNYVSPTTLQTIKPGMPLTDAIALMGEPTSRGAMSDGSEVCRWSYTRTDKGAGYVFLIFGGSDSTKRTMTTLVQSRGGVIERVWQDEGRE